MIIGQLHHGVVVSDIERAIAWYCDALGLELVHRQRQENEYTPVLVGVPGAVLEVAQVRIPTSLPTLSTHDIELIEYAVGGDQGDAAPVSRPGSAHIAFFVTDIDAMHRWAEAAGAVFRNPPVAITQGANTGGAACYLHDPDGNTLEFIQPAPERLERMLALLDSFRD